MLFGPAGNPKSNSLMAEYSVLLGEAVLRRRASVAEQSARIEAELASKVKSEFIANMSHELRTPLNTVMGFSKLLTQHPGRRIADKDISEYATLIYDAASHLLSVINDILDISKIQSGKYTLDSREVNIEEVVQAAVGAFRASAEESDVTLHYQVAFDLPTTRGDSAKLKQIVGNILSNAIKFTPSGGKVSVEALRTKEGGVAIFIRDTGVGMDSSEIAIALTPFGQVDGGRARWREGSGLGLSIAKALIELHAGQLDIRSAKGAGTEVSIILPPRNSVLAVTHKTEIPAHVGRS